MTELVPSTMTALSGDVWTGQGRLHLTGTSELAPLHRFPVLETLGAMLVRKADLRLTAPPEVYPL